MGSFHLFYFSFFLDSRNSVSTDGKMPGLGLPGRGVTGKPDGIIIVAKDVAERQVPGGSWGADGLCLSSPRCGGGRRRGGSGVCRRPGAAVPRAPPAAPLRARGPARGWRPPRRAHPGAQGR